MIKQLIEKAVTANKELVDALEKLSDVLGITNGSVFEGEHLRLTHELPDPGADYEASVDAMKIALKGKGKKKTGQAGLKNRAPGASMNIAKDTSLWPFETSRHSKREPSITIQKELKVMIGGSGKKGISRREIVAHIQTVLPPKMKKKENKNGFKSWKSSLGNLLRNYAAAGYLKCKLMTTNRADDIFTLGR